MDQISYGNMCKYGKGVFQKGQARFLSQGSEVTAPPNFGELRTCADTVWHTATKFCIVIKLDNRKIFTGSTPPQPWPIFVTQMLTRVRLAVANLLVNLSF